MGSSTSFPALRLGWSILCGGATSLFSLQTNAQSIVPAQDGTNTQVQIQGNELIIQGGSRSSDGSNLFYSFDRFNLSQDEIASFQSAPEIQTIIGRVLGRDASRINGLLQIRNGTSQLLLINPAGIVMGLNAQVLGRNGFTATTADRIGFSGTFDNTFDSPLLDSLLTVTDYSSFNGTPTVFEFGSAASGIILNEGSISVDSGQAIRLIGGQVLNTGVLNAPDGEITLLNVSAGLRATVDSFGIGFELTDLVSNLSTPSLSQLLAGQEATRFSQTADGKVILAGTAVADADGPISDVVVAGELTARGNNGLIRLDSDRLSILDPNISAMGNSPDGAGYISVLANQISGSSLNAGDQDEQGRVSPAAADVDILAFDEIAIGRLLGRNVKVSNSAGNIRLALKGDASASNPTIRAQTVDLYAPNGTILLSGTIQAGEVGRPEAGQILIEAQQFQAINPITATEFTGLATSGLPSLPVSLLVFPANVPENLNLAVAAEPPLEGAVAVSLTADNGGAGDLLGNGEFLIDILLQTDRFTVANGLPLGERSSGTEGAIGLGLSQSPLAIEPLVFDYELRLESAPVLEDAPINDPPVLSNELPAENIPDSSDSSDGRGNPGTPGLALNNEFLSADTLSTQDATASVAGSTIEAPSAYSALSIAPILCKISSEPSLSLEVSAALRGIEALTAADLGLAETSLIAAQNLSQQRTITEPEANSEEFKIETELETEQSVETQSTSKTAEAQRDCSPIN